MQTPIWKLDQILLQWIDAERVFDFEHTELAVDTIRLDEEFFVPTEETGTHAEMLEAHIGEIA